MHSDDIEVLQNISKRLDAGVIHTDKTNATLVLSSKEDNLKIFNILDIKPLNTTKYLNFLSFKEAFFLYNHCVAYANQPLPNGPVSDSLTFLNNTTKNTRVFSEIETTKSSSAPENLIQKIKIIKASMNSLRTNFSLPTDHQIKITPY